MQSNLRAPQLYNFIRLHSGKLLIIIGFILFIIGLFNIISFPDYKEFGSYSHIIFYETVYSLCFTFSVIFLVTGFALRFDLFIENTLEGKWGSTLFCLSFPLLTIAILLYLYREVVGEVPESVPFPAPGGHGYELVTLTRLVYGYPYRWLSLPLGFIGFGCLVFGLLLKLRRGI